jgi:hypothetical protein
MSPRADRRLVPALCLLLAACRDPATVEPSPAGQPSAASAAGKAPPLITAVADAPKAGAPAADPGGAAKDPAAPADAEPVAKSPTDPSAQGTGVGPAALLPLTDEQRDKFRSGEEDKPFPVDIHYVQSNETRHDLYFDWIAGKGGAYVGVGSDQNFTMMAVQRAEYAFLMDIDYRVVDLQRMHEILILAHDTPAALVDAWHEKNAATSRATIEAALGDLDEKGRTRILRGFATARETVYRHLQRVIARQRDGKPTTWLSDPENYAHVRAMYQTGRVRYMTGNLAGNLSLQTVAAACKALGENVQVLYMSNAEEYFKYIPDFVASIQALPTDPSSVVLRTIYSKKWVHADLWAYQVQPIDDFKTRLGDSKNRSRNPMMRYAEIDGALDKQTGREGLTLIALERD